MAFWASACRRAIGGWTADRNIAVVYFQRVMIALQESFTIRVLLTQKGCPMSSKTKMFVQIPLALIAAAIGSTAMADGHGGMKPVPGTAYVRDAAGQLVRDANRFCIKTGYFTKELATEECDPDLVPKKPVAPAPAAAPAPAPAPAPKPAPVVAPAPKQITLSTDALFDFDKAIVKPAGKKALDAVVVEAKDISIERVVVEGHTDSIGTDAYNQKLSERRAAAVKAYLIEKGVNPSKIETKGAGETKPVADNKTRAGRAQNRRVEVQLFGQK